MYLITGGSGFIGANLINLLLKQGKKIIDVDELSYCSTHHKYRNLIENKNYYFCESNINNSNRIINLFKKNKISKVFNLAAKSHVDRSIDNPVVFYKSNVFDTLNFIDTLRFLKKKKIFTGSIINISTDEVYGDIRGPASKENSPIISNSPYSASKASIENIFRSYYSTFKLPYINIRCCNNYGPYQHTEKFIPKVIINLLNCKSVPVYGDGLQTREWIYVNDFCRAIYFLSKNGIIGENYNVGSNERISNISLIKNITKFLNSMGLKIKNNLIKHVKDRPGHDRVYKINSQKLRNMGWKPVANFDEGLRLTVSWYLKNEPWIKRMQKKYKGQRLGLNV